MLEKSASLVLKVGSQSKFYTSVFWFGHAYSKTNPVFTEGLNFHSITVRVIPLCLSLLLFFPFYLSSLFCPSHYKAKVDENSGLPASIFQMLSCKCVPPSLALFFLWLFSILLHFNHFCPLLKDIISEYEIMVNTFVAL